jgi:hypothetical protein
VHLVSLSFRTSLSVKPQAEPLPDWVPAGHPARAVLEKYAGKFRWGVSYALIDRDVADIGEWEERLGTTLIGVGETDGGYVDLFLAADGRYFGRAIVTDVFLFYGDTRWQVFRARLNHKERPLFRPEEESIPWYGAQITRDDPRVYPW